jgi:hypothetical protein
MENPTPFDLNAAIRRWQQNLGKSPALSPDNLEELASHLRASVQKLQADGLSEEKAFLLATQRIGERGPLEQEYAKVNSAVAWSHTVFVFWLVAGMFFLRVAESLVTTLFYMHDRFWLDELLTLSGMETQLLQKDMERWLSEHKRVSGKARQNHLRHSRRALRCNMARILYKEDYWKRVGSPRSGHSPRPSKCWPA